MITLIKNLVPVWLNNRAHDFNDYAVGQRHGFKAINILTLDAKINENAPTEYQGLDLF
ncbi:hypothetical protein OURE66S_01507 [Oligella ureolytica]